jgi:hypothetical protein
MSVESDWKASMLAHAPLAALIATRLAPDKVAQDAVRPYVVYIVEREPHYLLDGALASTRYTFKLQCWADTRDAAEAVADACEGALTASALEPGGIPIEARGVMNEHDLDLEGTQIEFDIWVDV